MFAVDSKVRVTLNKKEHTLGGQTGIVVEDDHDLGVLVSIHAGKLRFKREHLVQVERYDVNFLIHLNVTHEVWATDEDEAHELAKPANEAWIESWTTDMDDRDELNEYVALADYVGCERFNFTTAADIAAALASYKASVESNTVLDGEHPYDAIGAVCRAMDTDDHTPLYEVQEGYSDTKVLDLDNEDVSRAIWAGLKAMTAMWTYERRHS